MAAQQGSPESLQQLVEIAKSTSSASSGQGGSSIGKDDKARLTKDKKVHICCRCYSDEVGLL